MRTLDKETAIVRMNTFGRQDIPFLFIIDYKQEHSFVEALAKIDTSACLYQFGETGNTPDTDTRYAGRIDWEFVPPLPADYRRSFDIVKRNLLGGNSYLTNLTCKVPLRTNLTLKDIFLHSHALYKLWLKDSFVCFSPEIFVRMEKGFIKSFPMKGTIDAAIPHARERLINDVKERAEHATITDLIRNDLSQSATEVTVTRFMYLEKLTTNSGALWQMSSEIRGRLASDYRQQLGDIIFRMLPAGSISGAPKKKTVDIIHQAENYNRGFYTGVMAYFDGDNLDSAVLIRFIEQEGKGRMIFKSGGGITFQSNVRSEYEEMKQKVYVPIY